MKGNLKQIILLLLVLTIRYKINATDITSQAFGGINDTIISAFGDFNSDELTDVFVRSSDGHVLDILLASEQEPLLRRSPTTKCIFKYLTITSIVPGDFDGDAYMDLLITTKSRTKSNTTTDLNQNLLDVYINWGESDVLNCTDENAEPLFQMIGEPMALDYNGDMIIDLFGLNENGNRVFWVFNGTRQSPEEVPMLNPAKKKLSQLKHPHSHAYLDLNNDFEADLFLSTESGFEIWHGTRNNGFVYAEKRSPNAIRNTIYGQSIFLDIELNGNIAQVLPICFDTQCHNSAILAYVNGDYFNLEIDFKDDKNQMWQFIPPDTKQNSIYQDTITLRGGDFNLDGYPDLIVTLKNTANGNIQTFLMENIKCVHCDHPLTRSFAIKWMAFAPYSNGTVVGAFYDFYQDGILDVIFVKQQVNGSSRPIAFRNTLDYDANFVKVMVLTGLTNKHTPTKNTPLGRKRRTYGSNLPGPRIAYRTTRPDGALQASTSAQIPQSGYFALQLPYTVLGLGRTANFVDSLTVGLSGRNRSWTLIIPNSQMVVVPLPISTPNQWKAQLFITPSKLIWMSVISLGATCAVITLIILVLHIKERRQDRLEKLQENQPLHFDAM